MWMSENDWMHKYGAVHVDNLLIAARDPEGIVNKFKLKGVGTLTFDITLK
jgi:hypothetical protein